MTEIIRVHRDAKGTGRWLEPVCERIRAMSDRFGGNADALVDEVYKFFADRSAFLGLFVGLEQEQIVGHVLAFIRQWDGQYVAWITQVEHDGVHDRALVDQVLYTLGEWVEEFNFSFKNSGVRVEDLLFCTPRMHDVWARHSGFTDYRVLKRRKIPSVTRKG